MKKKRNVLVALSLMSLSPLAGAVTLEELAARMEKLEQKVAAYEKRYGPLEEAAPTRKKPMSVAAEAAAAALAALESAKTGQTSAISTGLDS